MVHIGRPFEGWPRGDSPSTVPKRKVVFWFDTDSEVRYLSGTPEVGDHVTHAHEIWLVSRVGTDSFEDYVICKRPRERNSPVSEHHIEPDLA